MPIVSECHKDDSGTLGVVLDGSIAVTMCLPHPELQYEFGAGDMVVPPLLNYNEHESYGRPLISIACAPPYADQCLGRRKRMETKNLGVSCYTQTLNAGGVYLIGTGLDQVDQMRTPQHQVTNNGGPSLSVGVQRLNGLATLTILCCSLHKVPKMQWVPLFHCNRWHSACCSRCSNPCGHSRPKGRMKRRHIRAIVLRLILLRIVAVPLFHCNRWHSACCNRCSNPCGHNRPTGRTKRRHIRAIVLLLLLLRIVAGPSTPSTPRIGPLFLNATARPPQAGYGARMRYGSYREGLDVAIAMRNGRLMAFLAERTVVSNMQARQVGLRSRRDFVLI